MHLRIRGYRKYRLFDSPTFLHRAREAPRQPPPQSDIIKRLPSATFRVDLSLLGRSIPDCMHCKSAYSMRIKAFKIWNVFHVMTFPLSLLSLSSWVGSFFQSSIWAKFVPNFATKVAVSSNAVNTSVTTCHIVVTCFHHFAFESSGNVFTSCLFLQPHSWRTLLKRDEVQDLQDFVCWHVPPEMLFLLFLLWRWRLEGWKDGRMEGWKDGRMERWKDGRMEGWKDGRMEGWKDGRMEGWKDGRMEGWKDGTEWDLFCILRLWICRRQRLGEHGKKLRQPMTEVDRQRLWRFWVSRNIQSSCKRHRHFAESACTKGRMQTFYDILWLCLKSALTKCNMLQM